MMSKIKPLKNVSLRGDIGTGNGRGEGKAHGSVPCPRLTPLGLLVSQSLR